MIVLINGKEEPYAWGTVDYDDAIGQRSTASFSIIDKEATKRFKRGQNVELYDGDNLNILNNAPLQNNGWFYDGGVTVATTGEKYGVDDVYNVNFPATTNGRIRFGFGPKPIVSATMLVKLKSGNIGDIGLYLRQDGFGAIYGTATKTLLSNGWYEFKIEGVNIPASSEFLFYKPSGTTPMVDVDITNLMLVESETAQTFEPRQLTFGGVISRPVAKWMSLGSKSLMHGITCADWHYFADKRIIAKVYEETDAGDIVRDIITNILADEGITAGEIQTGPQIVQAVFNYIRVTDAIESLCEKAGFEWYIDAEKRLHFFARSAFQAPTNITETSDIKNVDVEPAAEDYRNKQYIRAGKDITDPQTVEFKGDGANKSFIFPYELALEPIVKVNGVAQTVGIRGLESNTQWYWNKGDKVVTQDDNATPLSASQTLSITGQGYFDIVVLSYDQTAVDAQQEIEGGTGLHEDVLDDPYLTSRAAAFESASAKLRRYARIGNKVSFETKMPGLRAGQLINIDLPSFGINATDFLIESVKAAELGTHDGRLIYQVQCVDGAATGGWANFFKKMATRGQAFVIRENIQENEVLITLAQFTKTWAQADNPNIFKPLYPSATLYPGATLYPSFEDKNRVRFVSFFNASNQEIFRKGIQKQTEETPGRLVTTVLILPYEANDLPIASIGFWGGSHATSALGTGTLVDKQVYNKTKSDLESIQIEKIDLKGW